MNQEIKKTKILFITVRADFGGGPEHLFRLVSKLNNNYEAYIACPEDYPYYERYAQLTGQEKIIKIPHRKFSLTSYWSLRKFINANKIDIVHSMGKGAGLYSRLLSIMNKVKCAHTFHGLHVGEYNSIQKKLYLILERLLSVFTDKFISVSKGEFEKVIQANISTSNKIEIIENGVVIPEETIPKDNFYKEVFRLVTFTRYDQQKYPELLISVIKELNLIADGKKTFMLDILGEGDKFELIKNLVSENNLQKNINQVGAVVNPQDYLINSACYLSTSRWEGHPLSLIESMAVGLPVVTSNVVGNNDIVNDNKNGILYELEDFRQAAKAIFDLSTNYERWNNLSNQAREDASEKFSVEKMVKHTENLYVNILDK